MKITEILQSNGYPKNFIQQVKERPPRPPTNNEQVMQRYVSTPYIRGTSERVNRIMKP